MQVGEVAAAPPGDQNLFANALGMIKQQDATAPAPSFDRTHKTGGTGAEHDDIEATQTRSPFL